MLQHLLSDKQSSFKDESLSPVRRPSLIQKPSIFFKVGTPSGAHLFDNLLWSIFHSSIFTHYIIQFFQVLIINHETLCSLQQVHQPCTRAPMSSLDSTKYSNSNLKTITYFHWKILALTGIWTRYQADMLPTELSWLGSIKNVAVEK